MASSSLANPLASIGQLEESGSQLDGVPRHLEDSIRFEGARYTQAAGELLRLPQEIIAQAIVVFWRFWLGPEGGSLIEFGASAVSASSLYAVTKLSAFPKSPRSVINVYAFLDGLPSLLKRPLESNESESCYVSEGIYQPRKLQLFDIEQRILKVLGFQLHISLPYSLSVTYLQALDIFTHPRSSDLAKRTFAHLNAALLSPQLLYLTHQPSSLATAAIYLAAKEVGIKLPDVEWWEVFDTDREELGFLVVALLSVETFAKQELETWRDRKVPMNVDALQAELAKNEDDDT